MRARFIGLVVCALLLTPAISSAQQPGEIFGKVTDTSGAVMPGVTVTLTSPVLLQPQTALTSETGTYRFPLIPIGIYTVRFELPGFTTVVREGIRIEIGFNAQINAQMSVSAVQETVTVSGESPIVDTRDTGRGSRFTQEALQAIPSARDPWVIIEQAAGVAMDRQNVGGSASGQQSNFVARGASMNQQKWNLDGVDITDMNATGGSPVYYDFDAFEEMQISTGGADVTMMTPGVGVNLVTKSGSDMFRGSGRYYLTDDSVESNNLTDQIRRQGASSGNPIQNIKDYGVEAGGPIKKGRAWIWGSYGKQDVKVGVNGFYKPSAECQAIKADALNHSIDDIRACLNADQTLLNNYNAKAAVELHKNNLFSFYFNAAEKVRNARNASDTHPIETTWRQGGVPPDMGYGSRWWKTGMPKTYKWSDRQIFTDKLMMEFQYAHVGNNFTLDFHEPSLANVQVSYDMNTGMYADSYLGEWLVRPTDSIDVTGSYFMPGTMGGDHSLKFGFKIRNDEALTVVHEGGNVWAVLANGVPAEAWLYRDEYSNYVLRNRSVYVQDTFSRKKLVVNGGVRFDYQSDAVDPATVAAHPFFGQRTLDGTVFNQLPSVSFEGQDAVGKLKNFSPRVGVTYDTTGDGRSVVKFNYSRYVAQIGSGSLAGYYNPVSETEIDYPWVDLNGDKKVQANEVDMSGGYYWASSGYDPENPTALTTTSKVSDDLQAAKTDEFIVGLDRQIGNDFAVNASYIWRRYTDLTELFRDNWSSDNYVAKTYTPPASTCTSPLSPRCEEITYYQPTSQLPVNQTLINVPDYTRGYNGFEVSGRKRMSNSWMMNTSFSYNNAPVHYDSPRAYQDPTNIDQRNGGEYAPESSSSGLDNVFVNAKWIFRLSGAYTLPVWKIGVAGFYNARSGYPWLPTVRTPTRPFGAGRADVFLDKVGDLRLPKFQQLDFRVDKPFTFGKVKLIGSVDVFNVFNENTILSQRRTQNASNANNISSIVSPRVVRFGVRATW